MNYPIICSPLPSKVEVDYPHLEDLQLAESLDDNYRTIDIHIGCYYYWEIVSGKTLKGDSGPTTVLSKLVWLLSGPLRDSVTSDTVTPSLITSGDCSFVSHENEELMNNLERFWQTEAIGIHEIKDASLTKEEFLDVKHNGERERERERERETLTKERLFGNPEQFELVLQLVEINAPQAE